MKEWTSKAAFESPLQYGLGVYLLDEGQLPSAQRLYYVPEAIAKARGRSVKPGWYVVARTDAAFSLRVTRIHEMGNRHCRAQAIDDDDYGTAMQILVDGVNPLGSDGSFELRGAGDQVEINGFTEIETYKDGHKCGKCTVREFRFSCGNHALTDEVEHMGRNDLGTIKLVMFSGPRITAELDECRVENDIGNVMQVNEKLAKKEGKSVHAVRNGKRFNSEIRRSAFYVKFDGSFDGNVIIYVREKFWMESRCLIDAKGNEWAPKIDEHVIEIVGDMEVCESNENVKRTSRTANWVGISDCKKANSDFVDLTVVVKDTIDLTK